MCIIFDMLFVLLYYTKHRGGGGGGGGGAMQGDKSYVGFLATEVKGSYNRIHQELNSAWVSVMMLH